MSLCESNAQQDQKNKKIDDVPRIASSLTIISGANLLGLGHGFPDFVDAAAELIVNYGNVNLAETATCGVQQDFAVGDVAKADNADEVASFRTSTICVNGGILDTSKSIIELKGGDIILAR